jgi:hypothetical protein
LKFDYLIIVGKEDLISSVDPLKTWKETIGYSVKVVTVDDIYAEYTTGDNAERIWNFLHAKYTYDNWAIRYILLVGDVDTIPMRMLYPDGNPPSTFLGLDILGPWGPYKLVPITIDADNLAYGSDYYYAKLDTPSWDIDGDNRWGEFTQDKFSAAHNVPVGRIPFNDKTTVKNICTNIVNFEKDVGPWKRNALLAHGILDYTTPIEKTDCAVLAEQLKKDIFDPQNWAYTTLYEKGGIAPSVYASNRALSQANFQAECGLKRQSVVNCVAHGNSDEMASFAWSNDVNANGRWDPRPPLSEFSTNRFSQVGAIQLNPTSAVVFLCGCSTGPILGDDPNFKTSTLCSKYLNTTVRTGIALKAYLSNGAAGVIASTAGSDYTGGWKTTADGGTNSLNYYFYNHLINEDKKVGDAFYDTMREFATRHGLIRGIRDFNYFGDPSLALLGIENRPGGTDVQIREGPCYDYSGDNSDDGDMYVAVVTSPPSQEPGKIQVFKSINHGQNWNLWSTVSDDKEIWTVDVLVGEWQKNQIEDNKLHVFYITGEGKVVDVRIDLNNPNIQDASIIYQRAVNPRCISVTRDLKTLPSDFNIYIAWEMAGHSASTYTVNVARSTDNGKTWEIRLTEPDYHSPHVDAGPDGAVYLVAVKDAFVDPYSPVCVKRSKDYGETWAAFLGGGVWTKLTEGDDAVSHEYPVVATSTDPSFPVVWVVYDYNYQSDAWGRSIDLRFAYSKDGGDTWTTNRVLSADQGVDESRADIMGHRAAPNRWVNIAYNYSPFPTNGYRRNIIWRYTSGSGPSGWSAQRIVNKFQAVPPPSPTRLIVIYSPGSPQPGSGVVYGGANWTNLYFSAPWLT